MFSDSLTIIIDFFVFVFGLVVGSFLNVCIYRIPREQSIIKPRSHCPKCRKLVTWYDNIPLLSYILLGGKCRYCKEKISLQYFIVELITGLMFLLFYNRFGFTAISLIYVVFVCGLIIATFVDFNFRIIPDEIDIGGIVLGLLISFIYPLLQKTDSHLLGLFRSLLGVVIGGGIIWLTGIIGDFIFFVVIPPIYKKIFNKEYYLLKEFKESGEEPSTMGGGDVKLLAMIGAFIGWQKAVLSFFIAPLVGAAMGIFIKFVKKRSTIPYGPFLALASLISLFYWEVILDWFWLFLRYN